MSPCQSKRIRKRSSRRNFVHLKYNQRLLPDYSPCDRKHVAGGWADGRRWPRVESPPKGTLESYLLLGRTARGIPLYHPIPFRPVPSPARTCRPPCPTRDFADYITLYQHMRRSASQITLGSSFLQVHFLCIGHPMGKFWAGEGGSIGAI